MCGFGNQCMPALTASLPVSQGRPTSRSASHFEKTDASGLAELLGRGTDAIGERAQLVGVEAVEVGVVEAEHPLGLVDRHVPEAFLEELACTATCLRGAGSRCPT